MRPAPSAAAVLAVLLSLAVAAAPPARAGGGPETTVVVVNGASPVSRRVANEYVRVRRIPPTHVCVLDGVSFQGIVGIDEFRARLWGGVKAFLVAGGLLDHVDLVVWSADFPYAVDFEADKPAKDLQPPWSRLASLTSMTYLWRAVEAKAPARYLAVAANGYYRRGADESPPLRDATPEEAALRAAAETAVVEKRWQDAAKAFEDLLARRTDRVDDLYNYACCLCRLQRLDDGVAALARAVAAGYADPGHAQEDPDLEPLRARDDFRALLERMATAARAGVQPSHAFRSRWAFTGAAAPDEAPAADATDRYLLSASLAYTGEWGNSATEALACLAASAKADGTRPDGTFYFLVNGDDRAKTRAPRFAGAVEALRALGRRAEVLTAGEDGQDGIVPKAKPDVLGAMLGTAGFTWKACGSTILPGAIVEHLTSHGADFAHGGQTKLSEPIRAGAAGASGTVFEPYAVQFKFPTPFLHVHYAAGCSLAEAFYQSVSGPYQLLVVGDPLCRPFATFATVTVPAPAGPLAGVASIDATVEAGAGTTIDHLELWVDGLPVATGRVGEPLPFDTTKVEDGAHDLRVVAVEAGAIGTRSFAATSVTTANGKAVATLAAAKPSVPLDGQVALSGRAPGATEVEVRAGSAVLARIAVRGDAWKATLPASALGLGTTTLQARSLRGGAPAVRSGFLDVTVTPPAARRASKPGGAHEDGLLCAVAADGKAATLALTTLGGAGQQPTVAAAIASKAKGVVRDVVVSGEFEVAGPGLYQLSVTAAGTVSVDVDGKPAQPPTRVEAGSSLGVLVALEAGWHDLVLRYAPSAGPDLTVLLGGDRVTTPLAGKGIRHAPGAPPKAR